MSELEINDYVIAFDHIHKKEHLGIVKKILYDEQGKVKGYIVDLITRKARYFYKRYVREATNEDLNKFMPGGG